MFNCERSLEQNGKALRKYLTYITEEKGEGVREGRREPGGKKENERGPNHM